MRAEQISNLFGLCISSDTQIHRSVFSEQVCIVIITRNADEKTAKRH